MDRHVETFFIHFNRHYADALATDFGDLSLQEQVAYVRLLYKVHVHVVMYSDCYMYMYYSKFQFVHEKICTYTSYCTVDNLISNCQLFLVFIINMHTMCSIP